MINTKKAEEVEAMSRKLCLRWCQYADDNKFFNRGEWPKKFSQISGAKWHSRALICIWGHRNPALTPEFMFSLRGNAGIYQGSIKAIGVTCYFFSVQFAFCVLDTLLNILFLFWHIELRMFFLIFAVTDNVVTNFSFSWARKLSSISPVRDYIVWKTNQLKRE